MSQTPIPAALRDRHQWVAWKRKADPDGKIRKLPLNAATGKAASSTDPATWATFTRAAEAFQRNDIDGIGFVFTPTDGFAGIDLDHCRDPQTGSIEPWAREIIGRLASYTEISPSETGVHIIVEAEVPGGKGLKTGHKEPHAVEIYDRGRYFCVTGAHLEGTPLTIEPRQAVVGELIGRIEATRKPARPPRPAAAPTSDAAKVIDRARKYVDKMAPAISGQRGHDALYAVAITLLEGFALSRAEARPIIDEYNTRCSPPWSAQEIEHKLDSAEARINSAQYGHLRDAPPPRGGSRSSSPRPLPPAPEASTPPSADKQAPANQVIVNTEEARVADEALAILARRDSTLYQRGRRLSTVHREERPSGAVRRPIGSAVISTITGANLRERLSRHVRFVTRRAATKKEMADGAKNTIDVPAFVPKWCPEALLARGSWADIRPLEGIVEAPTIRPDGTLLDKPGYDAATGLVLVDDAIKIPPIPSAPTMADAHGALAALKEAIIDFPFQSPAHRSAWIAGLLTILARPAIDGACPMFSVDATTRGSGKTLAANVAGVIATGRPMPCTNATSDDDEMQKRILSIALSGDLLVLLDNVAGGAPLGGASLDAAITASTWKSRILGKSENSPELPLHTVWWATGNNLTYGPDTIRRTLPIRLKPDCQNPEDRSGFRHPNLLAWVKQERSRLLAAGLTIVRAYFTAGRPDVGVQDWGSFEAWSRLIPSALVWAGEADPTAARMELREESDTGVGILTALLDALELLDPERRGMSAAGILEASTAPGTVLAGLRTVAEEWGTSHAGKLSPKSFGRKLMQARGRVIGQRALDCHRGRDGIQKWRSMPVMGEDGVPLTPVIEMFAARPEPAMEPEIADDPLPF